MTLKGELGLASGIGALISVTTVDKTQVLVNQWTNGYLSNKDSRVHIGLGNNETIKELKISWPDGEEEIFKQVPVNTYLEIHKGKGIQK